MTQAEKFCTISDDETNGGVSVVAFESDGETTVYVDTPAAREGKWTVDGVGMTARDAFTAWLGDIDQAEFADNNCITVEEIERNLATGWFGAGAVS